MTALTVTTLLAVTMAGLRAQTASNVGDDYTLFRECQTTDETQVRDAIAKRTAEGLRAAYIEQDFATLVNDVWEREGLRVRFHNLVDQSVSDVRDKTWLFDRYVGTLWIDAAERLASDVSRLVFESPEFSDVANTLIQESAARLSQQVEVGLAKDRIAGAALQCLQGFIDARYAPSIGGLFASSLGDVSESPEIPSPRPEKLPADVAVLAGGLLLMVSRRIVATIARSVATKVAGRAIAAVAGPLAVLVGGGMIVWDIWTGWDGPFPAFAQHLKSPEVEAELLQAFSTELKIELEKSAPGIARDYADQIMKQFAEFRRQHQTVMDLTETNSSFKVFVEDLDSEELQRLTVVVGIVEREGGRDAVLHAVDTGLLRRALTLPEAGVQIGRDLKSLESAVAWQESVPGRLPSVVGLGLHRHVEPLPGREVTLARVLDHGESAVPLFDLPWQAIRTLAELPSSQLRRVTGTLPFENLTRLSVLLERIPSARVELRGRIVDSVLGSGAGQRMLTEPAFADAVLESREPERALSLVDDPSWMSLPTMLGSVIGGDVDSRLLFSLFGGRLVVLAAILASVLLFLFRGAVFAALRNTRAARP